MADFNLTIEDSNLPRVTAAINGKFPNWQSGNPTMTIADFIKMKLKYMLCKIVQDWEERLIDQQACVEKNNLDEIQ